MGCGPGYILQPGLSIIGIGITVISRRRTVIHRSRPQDRTRHGGCQPGRFVERDRLDSCRTFQVERDESLRRDKAARTRGRRGNRGSGSAAGDGSYGCAGAAAEGCSEDGAESGSTDRISGTVAALARSPCREDIGLQVDRADPRDRAGSARSEYRHPPRRRPVS